MKKKINVGGKTNIREKRIWNKDYNDGIRVPHADIDFKNFIPVKDEETEKLKKVKVIRKRKKVKKK